MILTLCFENVQQTLLNKNITYIYYNRFRNSVYRPVSSKDKLLNQIPHSCLTWRGFPMEKNPGAGGSNFRGGLPNPGIFLISPFHYAICYFITMKFQWIIFQGGLPCPGICNGTTLSGFHYAAPPKDEICCFITTKFYLKWCPICPSDPHLLLIFKTNEMDKGQTFRCSCTYEAVQLQQAVLRYKTSYQITPATPRAF